MLFALENVSYMRKISAIILVCNFCVSATDSANDGVKFAQEMQQKLDLEELYKVAKDLEFLTGKLPAIEDGCKNCGSDVLNIQNKEASVDDGILVFVSFSMPKASLIELSDQAEKYNTTLVLRGIHEDSFAKTKDKILEINPKGLHLDIHPDLFKQYDIKRVPTFVLVKNGREVSRLSGNVTLEFAEKKLKEELSEPEIEIVQRSSALANGSRDHPWKEEVE